MLNIGDAVCQTVFHINIRCINGMSGFSNEADLCVNYKLLQFKCNIIVLVNVLLIVLSTANRVGLPPS